MVFRRHLELRFYACRNEPSPAVSRFLLPPSRRFSRVPAATRAAMGNLAHRPSRLVFATRMSSHETILKQKENRAARRLGGRSMSPIGYDDRATAKPDP